MYCFKDRSFNWSMAFCVGCTMYMHSASISVAMSSVVVKNLVNLCQFNLTFLLF